MRNPWKRPVAERFWEKVDRSNSEGCWFWLSALTAGYGYFSYEGRPRFAHRIAWILERGPIPPGLFVCHTCDVKNCVNPAHLFLGTHQENMRDAWVKGRLVRPTGGIHHLGGARKITPEQVQEIRQRRKDGELLRDLSAEYGISMSQVSRIATNNRWQGLPPNLE